MTTFLNINVEGKTPPKFILKHCVFSTLWIFGILIIFFRIDVITINYLNIQSEWLQSLMPIMFLALIGITIFFQKWYYTLALSFYPILAIGWFMPKAILRRGKIYLFSQYINFIFSLFKNFKRTALHIVLFASSISLLFVVNEPWSKWFLICSLGYFYIFFIINHISKSFKPAQLFGNNIEILIESAKEKGKKNESVLIDTFVTRSIDTEVSDEKKNKALTRLVVLNYALETINERLNGFRGKRAFMICLMFELMLFFILSILFFWSINYQLFRINPNNFLITGTASMFDFFYYSVKNIAFSETDIIKPHSAISKLIEVFSFIVIAVLLLILIVSLFFALRQDKVNENIKLTTDLCNDQNRIINDILLNKYGTDINQALSEVSNINTSLLKIKNIIDSFF